MYKYVVIVLVNIVNTFLLTIILSREVIDFELIFNIKTLKSFTLTY